MAVLRPIGKYEAVGAATTYGTGKYGDGLYGETGINTEVTKSELKLHVWS